MKLLEDYDDNGFIYERGYVILTDYFFQETHQTKSNVYFQYYQPDVINCHYSHWVCVVRIKLIEVQSKKKFKVKKWRMSKSDDERITKDGIPLLFF